MEGLRRRTFIKGVIGPGASISASTYVFEERESVRREIGELEARRIVFPRGPIGVAAILIRSEEGISQWIAERVRTLRSGLRGLNRVVRLLWLSRRQPAYLQQTVLKQSRWYFVHGAHPPRPGHLSILGWPSFS